MTSHFGDVSIAEEQECILFINTGTVKCPIWIGVERVQFTPEEIAEMAEKLQAKKDAKEAELARWNALSEVEQLREENAKLRATVDSMRYDYDDTLFSSKYSD